MILSIDNLEQMGAFCGAPVCKEIKWKQGKEEHTATVYVRRLSYHSTVAELLAFSGHKDAIAGRIAACICDEAGKPVFTPADITGVGKDRGPLNSELTMALLKVIAEVNNLGESTPDSI